MVSTVAWIVHYLYVALNKSVCQMNKCKYNWIKRFFIFLSGTFKLFINDRQLLPNKLAMPVSLTYLNSPNKKQ